jgi:hypothetical protein
LRFLAAEQGIRQFLDIGAGLPSAENVHEVAQAGFGLRLRPARRAVGRRGPQAVTRQTL